MENRVSFAPSLMCMDFLRIREQIEVLNRRADLLHVDVMDGHFCANLGISPDLMRAIGAIARIPMDVHLLTEHPETWVEMVAGAGAHTISPHVEVLGGMAFRLFERIEALGCEVGLVLNPETPLEAALPLLGRVRLLTIMTIDPGFAGQNFIPEMLEKIRKAKAWKREHGFNYKIQIDGQCNAKTLTRLAEVGAEVLIVGNSGLFDLDEDLDRAYDRMLEIYRECVAVG